MGIPTVERSLCGFTLKSGSKLIGWSDVVNAIYVIIIAVVAYNNGTDELRYQYIDAYEVLTITILYGVSFLIITIFMLIGVYKDKRTFMSPWIIGTLILLLIRWIYNITHIFKYGFESQRILHYLDDWLGSGAVFSCFLQPWMHFLITTTNWNILTKRYR